MTPNQKRLLLTYQEDKDYTYEHDHQRRRKVGRPHRRAPQVEVELQQEQQPPQVEELPLLHDQKPIEISSIDDSDESETNSEFLNDFCGLVLSSQAELRKHVQCPLCRCILKYTRVVMECQHRFCKWCIEFAIRYRRQECPICHVHCPSRRWLREDPELDAFIRAVYYPDADKYVAQKSVRNLGRITGIKKRIQTG